MTDCDTILDTFKSIKDNTHIIEIREERRGILECKNQFKTFKARWALRASLEDQYSQCRKMIEDYYDSLGLKKRINSQKRTNF